jgi:hypothetical protein
LGCGLGLNHAFLGQGQIDDAPEALALSFGFVPGSTAVADEDESDHVDTLSMDDDIVVGVEQSVKVQERKEHRDWESWIEQQIREAQEQGAFDDLPGSGRPLDLSLNPYAQDQDLAFKILKDAGYAPEWIELDKVIRRKLEAALATLERCWEWREMRLGELDRRSDATSGTERERVEDGWQRAIVSFEDEVEGINREIAELNLKVPACRFQRSSVNPTREMERLTGRPK